jgi:acyl-CoA synthetase (AMP-forming)/AMP-acid ligase II
MSMVSRTPSCSVLAQLGLMCCPSIRETYGPFMRAYEHSHWAKLPLAERAKLVARQGHQFATSLEVRVVYAAQDNPSAELVDVPRDGKTVGEIVTRGNITMKEVCSLTRLLCADLRSRGHLQYFQDPEATQKAFRGGWFNSGDLAVMHSDGTIAILDRSKDIIISGGEVR